VAGFLDAPWLFFAVSFVILVLPGQLFVGPNRVFDFQPTRVNKNIIFRTSAITLAGSTDLRITSFQKTHTISSVRIAVATDCGTLAFLP